MQHIDTLISQQDDFFKQGNTIDVSFRKKALIKLKKAILKNEGAILEALYADLRKPQFEAYTSEIAVVISELDYFIKNIERLAKPKRVKASLLNFPSKDYIYQDPYGRVLIMAPWNYPFQLVINPLVAAIAAGNCVICKPSEITSNTSTLLEKIIAKTFMPAHVAVVQGAIETNQYLLAQKWDYIFFTGSTIVGKIVMKAAAEHLTPITLELGGKSPVIIHKDANITLSAKRIAWGKLYNAGQTCIAPDYICVHESQKDELIKALSFEYDKALEGKAQLSSDYARIINARHYERIIKLMANGKIVYGGEIDAEEHFIAPTIIDDVIWDDAIMKEEIFGPLMPIISFSDLDAIIKKINSFDKPLAAYFFGSSKKAQQQFLDRLYFGGGCINDTIIHITSPEIPFGGVGASGIGSYHGAKSYETFSHQKGIVNKGTWIDLPFRYAPYKGKITLVKKLFKLLG